MISAQVRYNPNILNLIIESWSPTRFILPPQQFSQPRSMVHERDTVIPAYPVVLYTTPNAQSPWQRKNWLLALPSGLFQHSDFCEQQAQKESQHAVCERIAEATGSL